MGKVKVLSASAGSGKTYNLSYEYIKIVIDNPSLYRNILAVTFTNKATEEMKQRILQQINALSIGENIDFALRLERDLDLPLEQIKRRAKEALNHILHDYNNFSILTIDKFFQRIIRSFIKELGIDLNFNLELKTDSILSQATDKLIDDLSTDKALREWVMAYINENIAQSTKWSIKENLIKLGGELFKEEYKKLEISDVPKKQLTEIVAIARKERDNKVKQLTEKGREFMKYIDDNCLMASDFAQGYRGVFGLVSQAINGVPTSPNSYVLSALNENKWYGGKAPNGAIIESLIPQLAPILEELIEISQQAVKSTNNASIFEKNYRNYALIYDLQKRLSDIYKEENIVPIAEINQIIYSLIANNDTPFIFEKTGNRFTHFMIDELQDTSTMQWQNFVPLLQNSLAQSEDSPVLLVGDVKQSIYRWRGGDWSILSKKVFDEFNDIDSSSLLKNFRSKQRVVEFNNALLSKCIDNISNSLNSGLRTAQQSGLISNDEFTQLSTTLPDAYKDFRQTPNDNSNEGYVTLSVYDPESVHPTIQTIIDLQKRGYRPADIAVLVRQNNEAKEIATLLLNYKSQNPDSPYSFDVITQEALTIGSSLVAQFIVSVLSLAMNQEDNISRAVYNHYFKRPFEQELSKDESQTFSKIALLSPQEAFEEIVIHYQLDSLTNEIPYLQALHEQIIDFSNSKVADINLFLDWWQKVGCGNSIAMPESSNAITIATIHKSKGLGFKVVLIPYCDWSITTRSGNVVWAEHSQRKNESVLRHFPVKYEKILANSLFSSYYYQEAVMSAIDSLNMLYVALTRAKEELHIMIPNKEKRSKDIDVIIKSSIEESEGSIAIESVQLDRHDSDGLRVYSFGKPILNVVSLESEKTLLSRFETNLPSEKIAIHFPSQRYTEGNENATLTPRDYGILMHKVFETSTTLTDINSAIDKLSKNGEISENEALLLHDNISVALENKTINKWFDGTWATVRNESEIISPGGKTYRPDRVMISGKQAIVVDYKFGLSENNRYSRQVEQYIDLLNQMGYEDVRGYIWYITINKLVTV